MPKQRFAGPALAVLVLLALAAAIVFGPQLAHLSLTDAELKAIPPTDRLRSYNDIRTTLIQAIAGGLFLVTAYFGWRNIVISKEQNEIHRQTLLTDRLVRALGHLDTDKSPAVQLAGIYSLELVGQDSTTERGPIIELLGTLLRDHATKKALTNDPDPLVQATITSLATLCALEPSHRRPRLDNLDLHGVTELNARFDGWRFTGSWLDGCTLRGSLREANLADATLSGASLVRVDLTGANLNGAALRRSTTYHRPANLKGATLHGATLDYAHLEGVNLIGAQLHGGESGRKPASLTGAYLSGADLMHANLNGAQLGEAMLNSTEEHGTTDLTAATLRGAQLRLAHLRKAILTEADLRNADLRNADLTQADLRGADLREANLHNTILTDAITNTTTQWPADMPQQSGVA